jgi:hypothetical protein
MYLYPHLGEGLASPVDQYRHMTGTQSHFGSYLARRQPFHFTKPKNLSFSRPHRIKHSKNHFLVEPGHYLVFDDSAPSGYAIEITFQIFDLAAAIDRQIPNHLEKIRPKVGSGTVARLYRLQYPGKGLANQIVCFRLPTDTSCTRFRGGEVTGPQHSERIL